MKNVAISMLCAVSLAACAQIDTGQKGVVTEYGRVTDVVDPGLVWYNPMSTDIITMDMRQAKWEAETSAYTKDVQRANVKFTLTYRLDPSRVKSVYSSVGTEWAGTLIPQVVEQNIKEVFGQSDAVADTINNRSGVQQRIIAGLRDRLRARAVIVEGFEIKNIDFSNDFENAVERKQIAVQDAETAKNKTVEVEEQARQRVIAAKADAEAMKIKTAALSGNAKLVEYEAVQKWDGALPQNMYGANAIPFIGGGKK